MRRASAPLAASLVSVLLFVLPAPPTATQVTDPQAPADGAPSLVVQIGHSAPLTSVAWSPDGRFILTGAGDAEAVLWHAETGRELRRLRSGGPLVLCVAFSPDSSLAAVCDGFAVKLWDFEADVVRASVKAFGAESVAFSPDGSVLATGGLRPGFWDVATGAELRSLEGVGGNDAQVNALAFLPDGSRLVTGGEDGTLRFWDPATGTETGRLPGHEGPVHDLACTPDGGRLISSSEDRTMRTWDVAGGRQVDILQGWDDLAESLAVSPDGRSLLYSYVRVAALAPLGGEGPRVKLQSHQHRISEVAFSPDGRRALTAGEDYAALVWDLESAEVIHRLGTSTSRVRSLDISADGRQLVAAGEDARAWLWNLETGGVERSFEGHRDRVTAVAFSPDGSRLATGSEGVFDGTVRLWDVASGDEIGRFTEGGEITADALVFTPDGRSVLVGDLESMAARLWDLASGRELRRFDWFSFRKPRSLDVSPDGRLALLATLEGTELRRLDSGESVGRVEEEGVGATFSPDGARFLTGKTIRDKATLEPIVELEDSCARAVAFSPDGAVVACAGRLDASLHSAATGRELARLEGHGFPITGLDFTPDGRFVATSSLDQTVRIWEVATGAERARLIVSRDGTWAVVAPDGRFDTNNLDSIDSLHWILPEDPLTPLPVEIFLREYYEPGLLARILAGERFPRIPSIAQLNRAQPRVEITAAAPATAGGGLDPTLRSVDVTVQVASTATGTGAESQAHDLRLFRDGQLVAYRDGPVAGGSRPRTVTLTFRNIRLPRNAAGEIRFTAYAFNRDRVKSLNARRSHPAPAGPPIPGRAYLIHLGVNAYQNRKWDLVYSAGDARIFRDVLSEKLRASGRYREVVPVVLVSERAANRRDLAEATATAGALRAVLGRLAGENPGPDLPAAAAALRPAEPDDLVVVTFSGHGTVDGEGDFYLFPYDIGEGDDREITPELLDHAVSSDELSRWMRDVDAGEIVLVVDACHSAAAVEGEGFKAGPLGSRGLGQLAYDKGMRILAASQADAYAIESRLTEGGLLTYALVRDGLEKERADHHPADRAITLGEWLVYGSRRVPELADQIVRGETPRGVPTGTNDRRRVYQEPALFDFSRRPTDRVVATLDR